MSLSNKFRALIFLTALAMVSGCGFSPMLTGGKSPSLYVYSFNLTGNVSDKARAQMAKHIVLQDDAIFALVATIQEDVFEENIDNKRDGARETVRFTINYELRNRLDGSIKSGQFSDEISYTVSQSELDTIFELERARKALIVSTSNRLQQTLLQIRPQK